MSTHATTFVFDFDHSLVDNNTDTFVFDVLSPSLREKVNALSADVQWTELMNQSLNELQEQQGKTVENIRLCMTQIPFQPAMRRALDHLRILRREGKCKLYIASDSNTFYIDAILCHYGYGPTGDTFDGIFTNPAFVDKSTGRLCVKKFVEKHNCTVCNTVNMCKRDIYETYLSAASFPHRPRTVFLCDGSNDLCLVLALGAHDVALCRQGAEYGLQRKLIPILEKTPEKVQCTIVWWINYDEVEHWILTMM